MFEIPKKPVALMMLEYLQHRKPLHQNDQSAHFRMQKGFEGEKQFACVLKEQLRKDYQVHYSIGLEKDHSSFQIDNLIVREGTIHLQDVKNLSGDYFFQDKDFYIVKTGERVQNPLHQLQRCEDLLRGLLKKYRLHYEIISRVIFINPEFALYQAPLKMNFILPSQVRRFVEKLNQEPVRITAREARLVEMLEREHITDSRMEKLPVYEYGELRKGTVCSTCGSMMRPASLKLCCDRCQMTESVDSAIMRMAIEFSVLFPDEKITTSGMHEWCGGIVTQKVIRSVLSAYMKRIGVTKSVYYVFYSRKDSIQMLRNLGKVACVER